MRFIAEWYDEDGILQHQMFESEQEAKEFAICAYLDCLLAVSVRPIYFKTVEMEAEYEHFIADCNPYR